LLDLHRRDLTALYSFVRKGSADAEQLGGLWTLNTNRSSISATVPDAVRGATVGAPGPREAKA
jgi:hypothetical protein